MLLTGATDAAAQSKQAMKAAKTRAKEMKKEGWKSLGALTLQEQVARSKEIELNQDEWCIGEAQSEGDFYDAARPNAVLAAKVNIVNNLVQEITAKQKLKTKNEQGDGSSAASTMSEDANAVVAQQLQHPKTLLELYRNLPDGKVQVLIRMAVPREDAYSLVEEMLKHNK